MARTKAHSFSYLKTLLIRPPRYDDQRPPLGALSRYFLYKIYPVNTTSPGGGEVSPRKSVQSACQYDVASLVSDFQNGEQSVIEETDKNFDFTKEILFRFLGFGDFKVSILIEN